MFLGSGATQTGQEKGSGSRQRDWRPDECDRSRRGDKGDCQDSNRSGSPEDWEVAARNEVVDAQPPKDERGRGQGGDEYDGKDQIAVQGTGTRTGGGAGSGPRGGKIGGILSLGLPASGYPPVPKQYAIDWAVCSAFSKYIRLEKTATPIRVALTPGTAAPPPASATSACAAVAL